MNLETKKIIDELTCHVIDNDLPQIIDDILKKYYRDDLLESGLTDYEIDHDMCDEVQKSLENYLNLYW